MNTDDLADRLDDVGIGILASPYLAEAASKPLLRSPRTAPLGALVPDLDAPLPPKIAALLR